MAKKKIAAKSPAPKQDLVDINGLKPLEVVQRLASLQATADAVALQRCLKSILVEQDEMERCAGLMRHLKGVNQEARLRIQRILSDIFEYPLATAVAANGAELPLGD